MVCYDQNLQKHKYLNRDKFSVTSKVNYISEDLLPVTVTSRFSCVFRVATAQGKQGIWLLTFRDGENTGNLVNLIFYTGKIVPTQGKF